jgi:extracellular elastinolytic metalloproteinase
MPENIDLRDFRESRVTQARVDQMYALASEASARLAGDQGCEITQFDATTGNAATVRTLRPQPVQGNLVDAALRHVYAIAPALGLVSSIREFVPDPVVQRTGSGGAAVHVHQRFRGIPVFEAELTVRFDPRSAIVETVGCVIDVPPEPSGERIPVEEAVRKATAQCLAPDPGPLTDQYGQPLLPTSVDISGFVPRVLASFPGSPESPTVLEAGPFQGPIRSSLVWFPLGDNLRLGWDVWVQLPGQGSTYRTIVATSSAEVLYHQELVHGLTGSAEVYERDGSTPRTTKTLPPDASTYGVAQPPDLPAPFPREWLGSAQTEGNFTVAHVGPDGAPVSGEDSADRVTFVAQDPVGDDQKVVNLFYYCNLLHDVYYLLGFQEGDGNFQVDNTSRGGVGNDRVDARVFQEAIPRTARFVTPPDGGSPRMEMGLVTSTGRHCAFDATVVFHEYTHGVSSRLIGGPMSTSALLSPQSMGIAEGLSDFFSCALNDTTTVAQWVVGTPTGIRQYPYDDSFPDGFDHIGTGRYTDHYAIGELCAATLMSLLRTCGRDTTLLLVMDAMKLTAPNPSLLNLRDAILAAAEQSSPAPSDASSATLVEQVWAVFARFGMGPHAASNGAQLTGIVGDHSLPETLTSTSPAS